MIMTGASHAKSSGTRNSSLPRGDENTEGRPPAKVRELCTMSDRDFARLSEFIQASCGIKLPPVKRTMLEGRLRKRLHALGLGSFGKYCDYLFNGHGLESEYVHMIDAVTTNKTDFFREPEHFDYLFAKVLPELLSDQGFGLRERLKVWSAGCSTGEEPYTLAMVLSEFAEQRPGFHFSIVATDICTEVLKKAQAGIYAHEKVAPIPMLLRKKYLLRSKDKEKDLVRIAPKLRAAVRFERLNLMAGDYRFDEPLGIVFCRNVIIYFDRPTQEQLLNRISQYLMTGGYLFVGHAESLHHMDLPLVQTATTVYRKL
jgi:chemotaxis protein methyltransferase CheR